MDCSLPRSTVRGIFPARVLEWVAISFSRGSSRPREWTQVSCIAGRFFIVWATGEALNLHCMHVCSVVSDSLQLHGLWPSRLLCPWDSPGKSTGVGCYFLLQGIFPTQESNPGFLHCRQMLYPLSHLIAGRCFTLWATREAQGALLNTGSNISSLDLHSRPCKVFPLSCCSTEHSLSPNYPQHSWHHTFVHTAP